MIARPLDRSGTCVCGLPVALHFDITDRRVPCDVAKARFVSGISTRTPGRILPFTPRPERMVDSAPDEVDADASIALAPDGGPAWPN